jgi:hypothetical protein
MMLISIHSNLPHIVMQFGTTLDCPNSPFICCAVNSCPALSTGNFHYFASLAKRFPHCTYAWEELAIATGAAMNPEKCYAYFLSYWYNHGRTKLRTVKALPDSIAPITLPSGETAPSHLRVPLPNGMSAPIPTLRNEHASLMLGIYFGPTSGGSTYIQEMAKKVMRGPTASGLAHSHPALHGRVYSPAPTWNDLGNCYSHLIAPETFETVPTGVLSMSPAFERESPH